jgi:hypothetical protein
VSALTGKETPDQVAAAMVPECFTGPVVADVKRLVADAVAADRAARYAPMLRASDSGKIDSSDEWVDVAITALAREVGANDLCFAALDVLIALHADRKRLAAEWDGLKRPSGIPFTVVSSDAADAALSYYCDQSAFVESHETALRDALAHREHLRRQVNEAQAAATEQQTAKRIVEWRLRGAMAWTVGDTADANPFDNMRDNMAWSAWHIGWVDADRAGYPNKYARGKR